MINIRPEGMPMYHTLIPNQNLKAWKKGEMKDVLIAKYKCGRFAVMGVFVVNLYDATLCKMDFFYQIFDGEQELHDTFSEQLKIAIP